MIKQVIAAAALCSAVSAFAASNLVIDGSFESAKMPVGTWTFYSADSLYGWTSSTGFHDDIEIRHDAIGNAQDGEYFAELDSQYHNSGMSQVLDTVAGQTYTLSFWYSNRAASDVYNLGLGTVPADSNGLAVDFGSGAVAVAAQAANSTPDNQWHLFTQTFKASGTTTLSFAATGVSDTLGTSIDNIRVSAVPEPDSLGLMAAGLMVIAGFGRRRGQRKA